MWWPIWSMKIEEDGGWMISRYLVWLTCIDVTYMYRMSHVTWMFGWHIINTMWVVIENKGEETVGWMIMSWIVETDFETSKWRCLKRLVWLWGYLWLLIFNLLLCALLLNLLVCFFHVLIKCWYFPESILITLLHTIPTHLFSWLQQPAPLKTHRFLSLDIYPEFQLLSLTVLVVLI